MLKSDAEEYTLFNEIKSLVSGFSLLPVEVTQSDLKGRTQLRVILYKRESEITLDELEAAYNIIYPRYSVLFSDRDLSLEVSSPGLERSFKDTYEFTVFTGKRVRLYSTLYSSYVKGIIKEADDSSVILTQYFIEDRKEGGDEIKIEYSTIAKAKLDYSWEDKND